MCQERKAWRWSACHAIHILNVSPRIISVVFFRAFSITGFQKRWFASDVIFCIIDTDHNSQSTFICLKRVVMIMQPTCWLLVSLFVSYVNVQWTPCRHHILQSSLTLSLTPLWYLKVAIWWLPSNLSFPSITVFSLITALLLLCSCVALVFFQLLIWFLRTTILTQSGNTI